MGNKKHSYWSDRNDFYHMCSPSPRSPPLLLFGEHFGAAFAIALASQVKLVSKTKSKYPWLMSRSKNASAVVSLWTTSEWRRWVLGTPSSQPGSFFIHHKALPDSDSPGTRPSTHTHYMLSPTSAQLTGQL